MERQRLTCVIPVGPNHRDNHNLIESINADSGSTKFILVLDSTSLEIKRELLDFASKNPSIKTLEIRAGNPGEARNAGLKECDSEWVVFFDADDSFRTHVITTYLDQCEKIPDAIVFSYANRETSQLREEKVEKDTTGQIRKFNELQITKSPGIWRWVFRFDSIREIRFLGSRMGEDVHFLIDFLEDDRTIFFSSEIVYTYSKVNSGQLTKNRQAKQDLLRTFSSVLGKLNANPKNVENLELRIQLTSAVLYSCVIHSSWRKKLKALALLFSFGRKSPQNLKMVYKLLTSRLKNKAGINSRSEVIVSLTGGLGNQLFQLAHVLQQREIAPLSLVQEFGKPRVNGRGEAEILSFQLPIDYKKVTKKHANIVVRKVLGHTLKVSEHPERCEKNVKYQEACRYLSNLALSIYYRRLVSVQTKNTSITGIKKRNKTYFYLGYFQKAFKEDFEAMRASLAGLSLDAISNQLRHDIDYAKQHHILFIHVRLMDYFSEPKIGLISPDYFEKVLFKKRIESQIEEVWIFSDDCENAKRSLNGVSNVRTRFFSENEYSVSETFELMRYGSEYILSNSTFGWWAAFLSKKENPQVVIPFPWFKELNFDSSLYVPGWIREKVQWRSESI